MQSLEQTCAYCGVPMSIHGAMSCGWQNASPIIFPWETAIPAVFTEQEKRKRYLLRDESEETIKANDHYMASCTDIYHPYGLEPKNWFDFVLYLTGYDREKLERQIENWKRNVKK